MPDPKIEQAYDIARDMIADAAPAMPTLSAIADKVAEAAGVGKDTARRRVRAAIADGRLQEFKPNYGWRVALPGASDAGLPSAFYVNRDNRQDRQVKYHATGPTAWLVEPVSAPHSTYGPGTLSLISTPEATSELIKGYSDAKKAQEEAAAAQRRADKKAENKEIDRRFPGLRRLMRTFRNLADQAPDQRPKGASANVWLDDSARRHGKEVPPIEERELSITIHAWGDEAVTVLQSIMQAGVAAHMEQQPVTLCAHCSRRVLSTPDRGGLYWWHADTAFAKCADGDTKAEPKTDHSHDCYELGHLRCSDYRPNTPKEN